MTAGLPNPGKAARLRDSGRFARRAPLKAAVVRPATLTELREVLTPGSPYPAPFRPAGAGSAATDCNSTTAGTVVDMTAFEDEDGQTIGGPLTLIDVVSAPLANPTTRPAAGPRSGRTLRRRSNVERLRARGSVGGGGPPLLRGPGRAGRVVQGNP